MAKKLLNPLENPPTASSSDDDEVETSSGEDEEQISDSSSEEDEPKDPAKTPSTKTLKSTSAAPTPSSKSDSGSETDPDSESEPAEKPISAVPAAKPKKKESNGSAAVKSEKKRGASEGTSREQAKRAKKVSGDDEKKNGEDNKKPFQRLWSEEDEISLLQGMIDFKAETGTSPYDDLNGFYDIAKEYISFDVSKIQFGDKIRSLKKKYMSKDKKKGKESTSVSKPHEKKCLGLAKFIWGSDGMALDSAVKSPVESKKVDKKKMLESEVEDKEVLGSAVVKANGNVKKVESLKLEGDDKVEEDKEVVILGGDSESANWFEKSFLVRFIASLGMDEYSVKRKWSKVSVETKKRIEEKLKLLEAKEYELLLKKIDIVKDVTSVITETI